jgi:CBS domain-containing protein
MIARELMTQPVVSVRLDASLAEIAKTMVECRIGCVPVVDEHGLLSGIITQTDFGDSEKGTPFSMEAVLHMFSRPLSHEEIACVRQDARKTTAREIMKTEVITGVEDTPVEELARQMLRYDVDHIPVIYDGMPVGIVARHDFLRLLTGVEKVPAKRPMHAFD